MSAMNNLDVQEIMKNIQADASGAYALEVLSDLEAQRETLDAQLNRTVDVEEGMRTKAMVDAIDAIAAMLPSLWKQWHGKEFPAP